METAVYRRILDAFLQELGQKLDDGEQLRTELQHLREQGDLGRDQTLLALYARLVDGKF